MHSVVKVGFGRWVEPSSFVLVQQGKMAHHGTTYWVSWYSNTFWYNLSSTAPPTDMCIKMWGI